MSSPGTVHREISFYSLQALFGAGKKPTADSAFDWAGLLAQIALRPEVAAEARREFAPLEFDVLDGVELPSLAIYRPVGRSSMVIKPRGAAAPRDLDTAEDFELMNATAFFFLPSPLGVVCMLQGDRTAGSPPISALKTLATLLAPQEGGRWDVQPIVVGSQYEQLRRADGVSKVRAKMRGGARDDLFAAVSGFAGIRGFAEIADVFSSRTGTEVEVTLSVKIPRDLRNDDAERRLKEFVLEEADPSKIHGGTVTARALTRRGVVPTEETLTMARHDLTARIEIEVGENEPVRFSSFVAEAARDLKANAQRYADLALGGLDEPNDHEAR